MIAEQGVQSADEARNSPVPLIGFSPEVANGMRELRDFLYANLYQHPIVEGRNAISRKIIEKLFRLYVVEPATFDESLSRRGTDLPIERIVCDYIAGMTDRYALEKYNEHFNLVAHRHGTFTQR
jgi:dGTPase